MRFIKENKTFCLEALFLVLIVPIIFLWDCPLIPGIIPINIGIAIVGYGGSIIGGFLAIYGVWWTIKKQEDERDIKMKLEYKPILTLEIENIIPNAVPISMSPIRINILRNYMSSAIGHIPYCAKIKISNVSNFTAIKVQISGIDFGFQNNVFSDPIFKKGLNIPDIPARSTLDIPITSLSSYMFYKIQAFENIPPCLMTDIPKSFNLTFSLHYESIYGHKQDDSYIVSFIINTKIEEDTPEYRSYKCEFLVESIRPK
ncbi:hypothetical protein [Holdemania massiliensis]|uniref:hypothetical protein n=1 Tax=Holdemania massiliensis TaxID=1468449 RepID=UPI001F064DBE|nr:hypothetical protein [Holdemania massiliensis]MCH1939994.1 hypothetical protein [Holdemania massiliensis]